MHLRQEQRFKYSPDNSTDRCDAVGQATFLRCHAEITILHKHHRLQEFLGDLCKGYSMIANKRLLGADFWEGDATKHFSVKKKGFSVKRGEAIQ